MKPRKTLREMAQRDQPAQQVAGKPADVCPYCGCTMFANGTHTTSEQVYRYVVCKRPRGCGRTFLSKQAKAVLIREVNSYSGITQLTVVRETA